LTLGHSRIVAQMREMAVWPQRSRGAIRVLDLRQEGFTTETQRHREGKRLRFARSALTFFSVSLCLCGETCCLADAATSRTAGVLHPAPPRSTGGAWMAGSSLAPGRLT